MSRESESCVNFNVSTRARVRVLTTSLLCWRKFSLMKSLPTAMPIFSLTYSTHFCHRPRSRDVPCEHTTGVCMFVCSCVCV